jgi:hypothetical protein
MTNTDPILEIIQKSGNDFHLKVSKHLESNDWKVVDGPHYNDPSTNKPRETDILAEKNYKVAGIYGTGSAEIKIRLFIECKYIPSPIVFWFVNKDIARAREAAMDNHLLNEQSVDRFSSLVHHYLKNEMVAKLYASGKNFKEEFDTAINQVLNGLIAFSRHQNSCDEYVVKFPLIVVNSLSNLQRKNDEKSQYEPISDPFQMAVDYISERGSQNLTRYFLIDVISLEKIDDFLKMLENNDIEILKNSLKEKLWNRQPNQKTSPRSFI